MIRKLFGNFERLIALTLVLLLSSVPAFAGLTITGANGITVSGADGILYTGTNGITVSGADGVLAFGPNGITVSGADGNTYRADSVIIRNPTGITVSGADNLIATGTAGITASGADTRNVTRADGITISGADGITISGADTITAIGADGVMYAIPPTSITIIGTTGITVSGADGITISGADSFVQTGVNALTSALNGAVGTTGIQSVDPELAVLLNRLTDDSNVDAVIVYHHAPTDADIADLQNIGVLGGTRYRILPMVAITTTKSRLAAISHLPSVRSIYGNRTLQWNLDLASRNITGVERVR